MFPVPFEPGIFDVGFPPGVEPGLAVPLAPFVPFAPVLAGVAEREGFAAADWADPDLVRFWPRGVREDGRAEVAPAAPSPDLTVWV
ncbi:hypothetical protein, partial [Dietzia sp. SYD-A1]|uniref:hypothetical protein n=1 Tax=Dietzia sp. SYD-A1 TaxID=2780141 RepID=UPI001891B628